MSITQSLSDIKVMLQYIESLMKGQNHDQREDKLSTIGQNTLDIINNIKEVNQSLSAINGEVMDKHEELLEISSVLTKESLENLINKIEENESVQKTIHEDIQEIYTQYSESVSKVMSYMTNNKKHQEEIVDNLGKQIETIGQHVSSIDDKTLAKDDMTAIIGEISEQLQAVINADTEMDKHNQSLLEKIHDGISTTQSIMQSTSEDLQTIKDIYAESTSRLSIIDMKMENMTKHMMKGV